MDLTTVGTNGWLPCLHCVSDSHCEKALDPYSIRLLPKGHKLRQRDGGHKRNAASISRELSCHFAQASGSPFNFSGVGELPEGIVATNLDGANNEDLAIIFNGGYVRTLLNTGAGTFSIGPKVFGTGTDFVTADDFNQDSKSDVVGTDFGAGLGLRGPVGPRADRPGGLATGRPAGADARVSPQWAAPVRRLWASAPRRPDADRALLSLRLG